MKRIPIEMLLVLFLLGVALGIAWSRWIAIEAELANHNSRMVRLEADSANRLRLKTCAEVVVSLAAKCLQKVSFGLFKLH